MRFSYDREEDIFMIETALEGTIDHAEHTGPFIAHFSQNGELFAGNPRRQRVSIVADQSRSS